ncbi:MAG TPA: diguanylate cyclase [Nitrospirota bacterium]|nr:diguanylate cyclase [Nitrospirota bacterium]
MREIHVLAVSCLVMASITFYVAANYLGFSFKRPQLKEHLPFALLCFSVGCYDLFSIGLYTADSLETGIFWQRLQLAMMAPICIFFLWFTAVFTGNQSNRIIRILAAWFLLVLAITPLVDPVYTLTADHPAIKRISLFSLQPILYYEGAVGLLYQIEILSAVLVFAYLAHLLYRHYQTTRYRPLLLILGCQSLYFIGVLNDALVAVGAYSFIYLSEYAFFFVIVSMALVLFGRFIDLHREVESLNVTLTQKVYERNQEVEKLNGDLKRVAERDPLTGVYNRRFFTEYFDIEMKRAISNREHKSQLMGDAESMHFGLAIIDIDHFKLINDTYGHITADSVIMQVIAVIQENIFARDVLCRYGGDEFALLLTKTSQRGVRQAAEKIRREIDEHAFIFGKGLPRQHITVSIGLLTFEELLDKGREEALKLAEDRLTMAKIMGKNRIIHGEKSTGEAVERSGGCA